VIAAPICLVGHEQLAGDLRIPDSDRARGEISKERVVVGHQDCRGYATVMVVSVSTGWLLLTGLMNKL
jgi:hypothetical protein